MVKGTETGNNSNLGTPLIKARVYRLHYIPNNVLIDKIENCIILSIVYISVLIIIYLLAALGLDKTVYSVTNHIRWCSQMASYKPKENVLPLEYIKIDLNFPLYISTYLMSIFGIIYHLYVLLPISVMVDLANVLNVILSCFMPSLFLFSNTKFIFVEWIVAIYPIYSNFFMHLFGL